MNVNDYETSKTRTFLHNITEIAVKTEGIILPLVC